MSSLLSLGDSLVARITGFLVEDKRSLCFLCLVNKSINIIASGALYSKISVSSRSDVDVLRDLWNDEAGDGPTCSLISSCLPRNANHVKDFEVTAIIFPSPNQGDILRSLEFLLSKYTNLLGFRWQPQFCETELSVEVACLLHRLPGLKCLSFRVPFSLPPIPKAASPAKPAPDLGVIVEEDENEGQEEESGGMPDATVPSQSESGDVPSSDAEGGDSPSYEYQPLEDDPSKPPPKSPSLPYSIPPREMRFLRCLILTSPTNDVLAVLPDTLGGLDRPIQSLCLQGNCGPVTPGTLTSLLPVLQEATHFGLGLSYSVKYDEVIPFLNSLPKLRRLELFHYHQLYTRTSPFARLQSLKAITIKYVHTSSRMQAVKMCVWIRRLISASPLEELEVLCENSDSQDCPSRGPGHGIRHDGLVEHLVARHKDTLRVLRMPGAYVGLRSVRKLVGKDGKGCEALQELDVSVRRQVFDSLKDLLSSMSRMRSIRLNVVNLKRGTILPVDGTTLKDGRTALRSVIVNGRGFQGDWTVELDEDNPMQHESPKLKAVFLVSEVVEDRETYKCALQ